MERVTQILTLKFTDYQDYLAVLSLGASSDVWRMRSVHSQHANQTYGHQTLNILVKQHKKYDTGYRVYIADFGISRSFSPLDHSQTDSVIARCQSTVHPKFTNMIKGEGLRTYSLWVVCSWKCSQFCAIKV